MLDEIIKYLESDAFLAKTNEEFEVYDYRLNHIKNVINKEKNKDNLYYNNLFKLIVNKLDYLLEKEYLYGFSYNSKGIKSPQNDTNREEKRQLIRANITFAQNLFSFLCELLENNKNIVLDIQILKKLFNRGSKESSLYVDSFEITKPFSFRKMAEIISNNKMITKMELNTDNIYQFLIDTHQLHDESIFNSFISKEQFLNNHLKIDEVLKTCNAKTFYIITSNILHNYDENFDIFKYLKERHSNEFCENYMFEALKDKLDIKLEPVIYTIMTNPSIKIDYNKRYDDFVGQTNLKSLIAYNGSKRMVINLLSDKNNIEDYYYQGENKLPLYIVLTRIGDLDHAIKVFDRIYDGEKEYVNEDNRDLEKYGYRRLDIDSYSKRDNLIRLLMEMFKSNNGIMFEIRMDFVKKILSNKKIKYVDIDGVVEILKDYLLDEDFAEICRNLLERRNKKEIEFIKIGELERYESPISIYYARIMDNNDINLLFNLEHNISLKKLLKK